jgi:NADH dehydrogenase
MKRIVILGSGFGGMEAAVGLDKLFHRTKDVEVLIISEQNHFLFTPLLPQIASSYINPRHIVQTVRDLRSRRHFRFRRDTVHSIDLENRRIELTTDSVLYDYLVIALGSHTEYFKVSGAREHTWDFKSLEDAVVLRERIIDACEHADHTVDAAERRRYLTFIVVGGGYTGVELLAEMRDFMFGYVAKKYRGIPREEIRLILVEAGQSILNGVHPSLRKHALKRLHGEGIEIRYNSPVTRCFEGGIEIGGKEILEAGTVAWAAGVRAHELVEKLPGPHDRIGRALLNQYLQLEGHSEVFIIGDSAAAADATEAPRVAPVAISQGRIAARNIAHLERKEPLEAYHYVSQGMLVSLGMNDAVVNILGLRIHGYFAWLFWNAVHLFKLVGVKKQLQVALDWSLSMLFPRDAAIVRRPKGCKICAAQLK